jgi:hypothetical protein
MNALDWYETQGSVIEKLTTNGPLEAEFNLVFDIFESWLLMAVSLK